MKHTEAKAFVRKYNAELAIRGYSKMKKADLQKTIENKLSRSREELQREWSVLKAGPARPMAVKQGPRAGGPKKKQMGVKTPKRPAAVKKPVAKRPVAAQRASENAADDAWHARNKDTSGQAQVNRLNAVTDRLTRRAAMQRDRERVRRIRGR